jgi:hypothetical protein
LVSVRAIWVNDHAYQASAGAVVAGNFASNNEPRSCAQK